MKFAMQMIDRLTLDAPKITKEGYMAVRARAARAGLYDYSGFEVDPSGKKFKPDERVIIYRDADEVFSEKSVRSFIMKPITNDHPSIPVTSDNWKDHAKGVVAGAIRDGEYLAFDLVLMDKSAIADVQSGKRELSNGYQTDLDWTPGTTADGKPYHARQVSISGNHVALVDSGRAGSECRIADGIALCDTLSRNLFTGDADMTTRTITVDGIKLTLEDQSAAIVEKTIKAMTDAMSETEKKAKDMEEEMEKVKKSADAKDAEIATLKSQLADATDQTKLDAAIKDRSDVIDKAKALIGDKLVIDGKSTAEIRKQVVDAKLGDAAQDWTADQVAASFGTLTATVKAGDKLASALSDQKPATDAYQAYLKRLQDGYKTRPGVAA